ncbi:NADPH:quinone reductase [Mycobacterium intermedium]|uniref:NADPH:quinone reductase n=1 Tax=Mycobacterium intermedium TaxID=28445 RepID=A0A1E3SJA5_MYCIE|nr:quinone oxidoreductase [Mycobacterium intermedium]MCV6963842.1 quinone oxidoreductase [Mycobacterium intermedium]ODR02182.1 NADPH:quinone reductase [Mycobacterium intermedium]OPE52659.1 NADPH:quinone reductase [Mycobacterium intermedium]ORB10190.1 NADPH:quinone reductase [Mycobacterium intermedium]
MRAVGVSRTGGPEVLSYTEVPEPEPDADGVLIKSEAIGVNFIDTHFRSGRYPKALPFTPGNEVAGTVVSVGSHVSTVQAGDRVATADAVGAYAEYCVTPAAFAAHVPDDIASDVAAASLLKGLTAHFLINSAYRVKPGDTILLHAGAGGVGLILTQWATSVGARVITTTSTPAKADRSRQAGAAHVLDYPADPAEFGSVIRELTHGRGVAAVYDGVGRTTFDASLASLAIRGTLVLFGAASGPVPPVDPQRLNTAGSVYLTRPLRSHFNRTYHEFAWRATELFRAIGSGTVEPSIGQRYALADAAQAHRDLESRKTRGSTLLMPPASS